MEAHQRRRDGQKMSEALEPSTAGGGFTSFPLGRSLAGTTVPLGGLKTAVEAGICRPHISKQLKTRNNLGGR